MYYKPLIQHTKAAIGVILLPFALLSVTACTGATDSLTEAIEQLGSSIETSDTNNTTTSNDTVVEQVVEESTFLYKTGRDYIGPDYGATVPAKGETRVDPVTGVKITRLTDASELDGTNDALIVYSRYSPENSDGTHFLAFGSNSTSSWVVNRNTGNIVAELRYDNDPNHQIGEIHEVRWDLTGDHPYRVYFRNGMKFYQIDDVRNQDATRTLIKDFDQVAGIPAAATHLYNDVEGDSSNDSDHWAWMAAQYVSGQYVVHAFVHYQISTDTVDIFTPADLAGTPLNSHSTRSTFALRPNMVEVSPLGTGVVIHYGRCWGDTSYGRCPDDIGTWFDGPHLWPLDFDHNSKSPVKISVDESHSGWAFDESGNEYFISQNNRTDKLDAIKVTGSNSGYENRMAVADHGDFGWSNGFHYGKMPVSKAGWAFVNTYSNIGHPNHLGDWAADQFIMVQLLPESSSPIMLRIGSNYNEYSGNYRDEAPAAINQLGNRIYVSNNWGGNLGHREVFVFELPINWDTEALQNN